jgi:hypothetical protein
MFLNDKLANFRTEMAGNIIPAIATTNAITAGLCVLQALKVLRGKVESGKMVSKQQSAGVDEQC